jgi:hypothetical protein
MDARGSGENRSFVYTTGRFRDVRGLDAFSVSVTTLRRRKAREGFQPSRTTSGILLRVVTLA